MRVVLLALAATLLLPAAPAQATGGIYCLSPDEETLAVMIITGRVPGLSVANATIAVGDAVWSMDGRPGASEIYPAQAAVDGERLVADFSDPNAERILVSLRLVLAPDGGGVAGGILTLPDLGVWPVTCTVE